MWKSKTKHNLSNVLVYIDSRSVFEKYQKDKGRYLAHTTCNRSDTRTLKLRPFLAKNIYISFLTTDNLSHAELCLYNVWENIFLCILLRYLRYFTNLFVSFPLTMRNVCFIFIYIRCEMIKFSFYIPIGENLSGSGP